MDESKPEEIYLSVNDIEICCFRWGDPVGRALLLVHATGFHARCWDQVIAHLPSDWNIVSVDMRGHGRSEKKGPYKWAQFGSDLSEVTSQLGIKKAIGVGHSMGGYCVTEVAYLSPDVFSDLVLVDPVIRPPETYDSQLGEPYGSVEDHPIARRRSHFESWVEMYDRYEQRSPYSLWHRQVFEDYCRHGVVPARVGSGVELACPGSVEASIYMGNNESSIHEYIPNISQSTKILRAPPRRTDSVEVDFTASPTWPDLVNSFPNAEELYLDHLTHFIPMQEPELVANVIKQVDAGSAPTKNS